MPQTVRIACSMSICAPILRRNKARYCDAIGHDTAPQQATMLRRNKPRHCDAVIDVIAMQLSCFILRPKKYDDLVLQQATILRWNQERGVLRQGTPCCDKEPLIAARNPLLRQGPYCGKESLIEKRNPLLR